jgi:hypothetical protein
MAKQEAIHGLSAQFQPEGIRVSVYMADTVVVP